MKFLILLSLIATGFSVKCDNKSCYPVIQKCQSNSTTANQYYDCILKTNQTCFNCINSSLAQPIHNPKSHLLEKDDPSTINFKGYQCNTKIMQCKDCYRCHQTCLDHGYYYWCCFTDDKMDNCCCYKDPGSCDRNGACAMTVCDWC